MVDILSALEFADPSTPIVTELSPEMRELAKRVVTMPPLDENEDVWSWSYRIAQQVCEADD